MLAQFKCRKAEPDVTVMDFTGQFSLGTTLILIEDAVRDCIKQGCRKLVLDLSKVNYVDSAGVGMLVVCSSVMEMAGGKMAIAGAGGKVKQVLEITHVDRVLTVCSDLGAACSALGASAAPPAS